MQPKPLCKHQVHRMAWSPRRAETCLAPFRALPCTTTVTTRIGEGPYTRPQLALPTYSLQRFQTRMPEFDSCIRLFVTAVLMSLDCSEDLRCLGNIHIHRHSFSFPPHAYMHARTYVDTHSFLYVASGSSVSIHCIHRYYFDLRIYTNSDTTLHALTLDTTTTI